MLASQYEQSGEQRCGVGSTILALGARFLFPPGVIVEAAGRWSTLYIVLYCIVLYCILLPLSTPTSCKMMPA